MLRTALASAGLLLILSMGLMPGRAQTTSLQTLVDATAPGATASVPAGIYREHVTIAKPLTLVAQPGAEIRGSDVWDAWQATGGVWLSQRALPAFAADESSAAYVDRFQATSPEQVFVNGAAQEQVAGNPQPGQFALDAARRVRLGSDPTGKLVEVTVRAHWIDIAADDVTIDGLTMRHAANSAQDTALHNAGGDRTTLRDLVLSDAHGSGLGLGDGTRVLGSTLQRIGNTAIQGYDRADVLISDNSVSDNGYGGWDWGWQSGGMKLVRMRQTTVERNTVFDNGGPGIWCDIGCDGVTINSNKVHDNAGPSVFYEISTNGTITDNSVWNQPGDFWPALYVSSSANVQVADNVVAWSGRALQVYTNQRSDAPPGAGTGVTLRDNTVVMGGNGYAAYRSDQGPGTGERYWYPTPENGALRWRHGEQEFARLADYARSPGGQGAAYLTDAEARASLQAAGIPQEGIPDAPAPTMTPRPTSTPQPTPVPSMTPTRTPTPTPLVVCEVRVRENGVIKWLPRPVEFCQ